VGDGTAALAVDPLRKKPFTLVWRWNIRFCPTCPLELPRTPPPGAGESRQSRADSMALAARTKAPATTCCVLPSPSMYSTALTWPPSFTRRVADALKRSWQRPERSAARSMVTAGEPFELLGHPNPLHRPQSTHGGRSP
jgi:hypothetical protein